MCFYLCLPKVHIILLLKVNPKNIIKDVHQIYAETIDDGGGSGGGDEDDKDLR